METRQPSILPYTAVAVIAAIVGGALVYAFGAPSQKSRSAPGHWQPSATR